MILKNDFYHIAQASVDLPRATYEIALNAQHFIYQANRLHRVCAFFRWLASY